LSGPHYGGFDYDARGRVILAHLCAEAPKITWKVMSWKRRLAAMAGTMLSAFHEADPEGEGWCVTAFGGLCKDGVTAYGATIIGVIELGEIMEQGLPDACNNVIREVGFALLKLARDRSQESQDD